MPDIEIPELAPTPAQTIWANRTMIVTAGDAPFARELCAAIDGAGGVGMFTTGLSADGLPPATHYISAGFIDEKFANLWPLTTFDPEGVPTTLPGRPVEMTAQAVDAGLIVTVQAVSAMLSATDVTEIEPLVRMAELGLQLSALPEAQPR